MTEIAERSLFAKLAEISKEIERVPKSGHNDHQNYDYATASDIFDTIRPLMAERGLVLIPELISAAQDSKKSVLDWRMHITDAESGEQITIPWTSEAHDALDKGMAKAATNGKKSFFVHLFNISTGDLSVDSDNPDAARPDWLTPEAMTKLCHWAFVTKGLTPEQLYEALGEKWPIQLRVERKSVAVAMVESYLSEADAPAS